jgi:hypothetical protein
MRAILAFVATVLFVAVVTRIAEAAGMRTCGCAADCWCKRPGLELFRWIVPFGHSSLDPDEKAARAADLA